MGSFLLAHTISFKYKLVKTFARGPAYLFLLAAYVMEPSSSGIILNQTPTEETIKVAQRTVRLHDMDEFTKQQKFNFALKIVVMTYKFEEDAKKRNVPLSNILKEYSFSLKDKEEARQYGGLCDSENNRIYFREEFTESTFYHELGHCELGYSHIGHKDLFIKGKSPLIMSWYTDEDVLTNNREKTLDQFFLSEHKDIHSNAGTWEHYKMLAQIRLHKIKALFD